VAAVRIEPTISTFSVTKGGRVEETYACLAAWDLSASLDENLDRMRRDNPILAPTDRWLTEMRRIFRVRFGTLERHLPLVRLAKGGLPLAQWTPILLWHLCLRELLLSDFLESWLFPRKLEGLLRVRGSDVREYLADLRRRGLLGEEWSPSTVEKMASSLPRYAADFGLLQGRAVKEIAASHLPDEALLYVLHDLAEQFLAPGRMLEDRRWRRFLLSRQELEVELLRLHQLRRLRFEIAGTLVSLELPYGSVDEYVEHLVG